MAGDILHVSSEIWSQKVLDDSFLNIKINDSFFNERIDQRKNKVIFSRQHPNKPLLFPMADSSRMGLILPLTVHNMSPINDVGPFCDKCGSQYL